MKISEIWRCNSNDLIRRLEKVIGEACKYSGPVRVFFRADDIGVPSKGFFRMMDIFSGHGAPLCLAVVPSWVTESRWRTIREKVDAGSSLWCWHQHGRRHLNHEKTGKKMEFGPGRPRASIELDLVSGRKRLERILGADFFPFFTPPWNRCGSDALDLLAKLGYYGISRSRGARPDSGEIPDYFVNADLHTRKETDPATGADALLSELAEALSSGYCGIMIHHQRMNDSAFSFLDAMLEFLKKQKNVDLKRFNDFPLN